MRLGALFVALEMVGVLGCRPSPWGAGGSQILVGQAGRDQALLRLIHGARRSIYLQTEQLTLVPVANELAQAVQRGVAVNLDLPLEVGSGNSRLLRVLMQLGAVVAFKEDATGSIRGAYLEVDGQTFLYSAAPVTINVPGACVSFVTGPARWRGVGWDLGQG